MKVFKTILAPKVFLKLIPIFRGKLHKKCINLYIYLLNKVNILKFGKSTISDSKALNNESHPDRMAFVISPSPAYQEADSSVETSTFLASFAGASTFLVFLTRRFFDVSALGVDNIFSL